MTSSLENFRPRLRPGKVIPQGSRLIFETNSPYNQIILPMNLADLILLCGGQFTVGEIVGKIYQKQGTVPFKSILKAIHVLHQGGFFENGDELELNSHLRAWMDRRRSRRYLAVGISQKIVAERVSPIAFYVFTLGLLIGSLFGLQLFHFSIFQQFELGMSAGNFWSLVFRLIVCSSLLQTVKAFVRGLQLVFLTGKVYNLSLRLDFWGLHLHVGDESSNLFDNKLYMTMFYLSQIVVGWTCAIALAPVLSQPWSDALLTISALISFWETNPFVASEGLKLIQALLLPVDRDVASWHFETSAMTRAFNADSLKRNEEFMRICTIWGTLWLLLSISALQESAIAFGPTVLAHVMHYSWESIPPLIGLGVWLVTLFFVVQAFVETVATSILRPCIRFAQRQMKNIKNFSPQKVSSNDLLNKIKDLPLFSHFHDGNLNRILDKSQVLEFHKGQLIVGQGERSADLYVLIEGDIEVRRRTNARSEWITELSSVSIFGEAALIGDAPRAADVLAKNKVTVLKVPVSTIRQVAEESKVIREVDAFRNAIMVNQFFASSPVFNGLSPETTDFLCSRGALEYFEGDQTIFRQGDSGDSLYLILRGNVSVEVHGQKVKKIGQGNFFGEIALLANIPRTGTVITAEPCVFFRISADSIWQVLIQNMDLAVFIESVSEARLREDLDLMSEVKRTGTES